MIALPPSMRKMQKRKAYNLRITQTHALERVEASKCATSAQKALLDAARRMREPADPET